MLVPSDSVPEAAEFETGHSDRGDQIQSANAGYWDYGASGGVLIMFYVHAFRNSGAAFRECRSAVMKSNYILSRYLMSGIVHVIQIVPKAFTSQL